MSGWEGSVTMALIGSAFLFAYLYSNTDELNKVLKILFLAAAMLSGLGSVAIQEDIILENGVAANATITGAILGTYSMQIMIFRISMIVVFIWLLYAILHGLLRRSDDAKRRWG